MNVQPTDNGHAGSTLSHPHLVTAAASGFQPGHPGAAPNHIICLEGCKYAVALIPGGRFKADTRVRQIFSLTISNGTPLEWHK